MRVASGGHEGPLDTVLFEPSVPDVDLSRRIDIEDVLEDLSPEQRVVLVLRHIEDLSEDEVARILRIPPGTVKSRLYRARAAFMRRWVG